MSLTAIPLHPPFSKGIQVHLPPPSLQQECGLCMENSPRLLPCSHTFCLSCLKSVVSSQPHSTSFPCPTCRSPTHIPPGGVDSLQQGFNWKVTPVRKLTDLTQAKSFLSGGQNLTCPKTHHPLKEMAQERFCTLHAGHQLCFYCLYCRTPICRDCKMTQHERHQAIGLREKATELKTLISEVMQVPKNELGPKLRQTLIKAENHRKSLKEKKQKILDSLEQRRERVKKAVDEAFWRATEELNEQAAEADGLVGKCVDAMTQGLGSFLSLSDHVEITSGDSNADVVDLLPVLTKFFAEACQQATEGYQIVEKDTPLVSKETCPLAQEGPLRVFLTDDWRMNLQLSDSESTKDCPFCSFKYPKKAVTCPMCCAGKPKPSSSKNFFGFKSRKSSGQQVQCTHCRQKYDVTCDFCPGCGTPASQDVLTTTHNLVAQYIGHVSRQHQSEAGDWGRQSPAGSRSPSPKGDGQCSEAELLSRPPPKAGREAWEMFSLIRTISTLLQGLE